jgi:hypothetical protein
VTTTAKKHKTIKENNATQHTDGDAIVSMETWLQQPRFELWT